MKRLTILLITLLLLYVLGSQAYGAVFNVSNPAQFQDALTIAQGNGEDDTINVAPGVYNLTTTLTYNADENFTLSIIGTGADSTILDGGNNVRVLEIDTSGLASDNSAHISISGITIQNGYVSGYYTSGGEASGLYVITKYANITVKDSRFISNYIHTIGCAYAYGSGAYITSFYGNVNLINNIFSDNENYTEPECEMRAYGGGAYVDGLGVTLINNIFNNNIIVAYSRILPTYTYGGGIYVFSHTATLVNNTFIGNGVFGGIFGNHGGGAYVSTYNTNIYNNIFWDNTAQNGADLYAHVSSQGNLFNNTFQDALIVGSFNQGNNIQQDCLLTPDFHLQAGSPCIDAGDNSAPELPTEDFEGDSRIIDGDGDSSAVVDIGADEYNPFLIDIKANGSDGPVTLNHGDPLSVTIALNCGGDSADWWVVVNTPLGWYRYDPSTDSWKPGLSCSYQGSLVNLSSYEVLNTTAGPQMLIGNTPDLPTGTYTFYFGVDMNMNCSLDMGQMYYDSVEVNIIQ
jgi:hypothetical protein